MSTTVTFAGTPIQCAFVAREVGDSRVRTDRAEMFGLDGASSITGGFEPQQIAVLVELNNFATSAALFAYVQNTLKPLQGKVGTLALAGTVAESYLSCQLDSMQLIDSSAQKGPAPSAVGANPWTQHVRLTFTRLS